MCDGRRERMMAHGEKKREPPGLGRKRK